MSACGGDDNPEATPDTATGALDSSAQDTGPTTQADAAATDTETAKSDSNARRPLDAGATQDADAGQLPDVGDAGQAPPDKKITYAEMLSCVEKSCPAPFATCMATPLCKAAVECLAKCPGFVGKSDMSCLEACKKARDAEVKAKGYGKDHPVMKAMAGLWCKQSQECPQGVVGGATFPAGLMHEATVTITDDAGKALTHTIHQDAALLSIPPTGLTYAVGSPNGTLQVIMALGELDKTTGKFVGYTVRMTVHTGQISVPGIGLVPNAAPASMGKATVFELWTSYNAGKGLHFFGPDEKLPAIGAVDLTSCPQKPGDIVAGAIKGVRFYLGTVGGPEIPKFITVDATFKLIYWGVPTDKGGTLPAGKEMKCSAAGSVVCGDAVCGKGETVASCPYDCATK